MKVEKNDYLQYYFRCEKRKQIFDFETVFFRESRMSSSWSDEKYLWQFSSNDRLVKKFDSSQSAVTGNRISRSKRLHSFQWLDQFLYPRWRVSIIIVKSSMIYKIVVHLMWLRKSPIQAINHVQHNIGVPHPRWQFFSWHWNGKKKIINFQVFIMLSIPDDIEFHNFFVLHERSHSQRFGQLQPRSNNFGANIYGAELEFKRRSCTIGTGTKLRAIS